MVRLCGGFCPVFLFYQQTGVLSAVYLFVYRNDDQSDDLYLFSEWNGFESACGCIEEFMQLSGSPGAYCRYFHECISQYSCIQFAGGSCSGHEQPGFAEISCGEKRLFCPDDGNLPVHYVFEAALGSGCDWSDVSGLSGLCICIWRGLCGKPEDRGQESVGMTGSYVNIGSGKRKIYFI